MIDTLIAGGTVVDETGQSVADVAIDAGRIVAVGPCGSLPEAREVIDAQGLTVLPGMIGIGACLIPEA